MTDLADKVLIVTGASRGIGAAAARLFAERGATVVLAARDEHALTELASEIDWDDREAFPIPTDVTDVAAVEHLISTTIDRYQRLDGAFNNAGDGHQPTPLAEIEPADFDRTLDVNLRGVFLCLRAELPHLAAGGAIVNMASSAGLSGAPGMGAYSAAKHGVIGLTQTAALDYGPKGVRVNAIAPGPVLTDGGIGAAPAKIQEQVAQTLPLKRLGTPDEVAHLAALGRGLIRQRRHDPDRRRQTRRHGIDGGRTLGQVARRPRTARCRPAAGRLLQSPLRR